MLAPAALTSVTPLVFGPTPFTEAVIRDPAGEPVLGVTERNYGARVMPVVYIISSTPLGVPMGR